MKRISILLTVLATLFAGVTLTSCGDDMKEIIEDVDLSRCLTPLNLSVRITSGDQVTFRWDAVSGADTYILEVYGDEGMTQLVESVTATTDELPVTIQLVADSEYWFRVMARDSQDSSKDSKWAVYDGTVTTYAVKETVYPAVSDRTTSSITVSWDVEAAEGEITTIKYNVIGSDEVLEKEVTAEEIAAGAATIDGLTEFTNYVVGVYYMSASRGEISAWTRANTEGYAEITTSAGLAQAAADGGQYLLKMEGSPYSFDEGVVIDLANGIEIVGEEDADGTQPVINNEFHILNSVPAGASFIFKSLELNGVDDKFGFAIQLKNGAAGTGMSFDKIQFVNCTITGYSKGLIYEWDGNFTANEVTWDGCEIYAINESGTGGGDGIDLRQATTISALNVVNNTIYNSFRTFLRLDANVTIGALAFNNNTIMNLSRDDESTNNNGVMGIKCTPSSMQMRNNLFHSMTGNAKLVGNAAANVTLADMSASISTNYYYGCDDSFFATEKTSQAEALTGGGQILSVDPCYKAQAGIFNISDTDIINAKVGAPRWLMAYNKKPEDLTMHVIEGTHNWDFTDATNFLGEIDESMVRDGLFMGVSESNLNVNDIVAGTMLYQVATTVNRTGVPVDGYLAFLVDKPGSVYIKPVDYGEAGSAYINIAKGDVNGAAASVKGGAAVQPNGVPQKIIIRDITEESLIYLYANGPIGIESLGWAYDTTAINTALPTPVVSLDPEVISSDSPQDVTVSWEEVPGAGSYSVVLGSTTYEPEDGELSLVIPQLTIRMLSTGAYTVRVYANPASSDCYNTQSEAGTASFAIQPSGGGGDTEFVVNNIDELRAALEAGRDAITLAAGEYAYGETMTVANSLSLKGQDGAVLSGVKFSITGTDVSLSLENLGIQAGGNDNMISSTSDASIADISVIDCDIDGFTKSIYYQSNAITAGNIVFQGLNVTNQGAGQGTFDIRKGTVGSLSITESTFNGGCRDFIRLDNTSNVTCGSIDISRNTFYNVSAGASNGFLYVRNNGCTYTFKQNLVHSMACKIVRNETIVIPTMEKNYYFNCGADFFTEDLTEDMATAANGVVLANDPCADAANGDFTLVNALAISEQIGDPRWYPSYPVSGETFEVASVAEFQAALDAGKTDIKFMLSGSPYDISGEGITLAAGMKLRGEEGANGEKPQVTVTQLNLNGAMGSILLDGIHFVGAGNNNFINVSAEGTTADQVVVRNCDIESVGKSLYYDNSGATVNYVTFDNVRASNLGGGQGTIDMRKGSYSYVTIKNCTIVGGRDFIRVDAGVSTQLVNISNNIFDSCTLSHNNGILYVRSVCADQYVVNSNLFLNENGSNNKLSSSNTANNVPNMKNNWFYNCTAEAFWSGVITQEVATAGGGILEASPVADAAAGDYTLTNNELKAAGVGPERYR